MDDTFKENQVIDEEVALKFTVQEVAEENLSQAIYVEGRAKAHNTSIQDLYFELDQL